MRAQFTKKSLENLAQAVRAKNRIYLTEDNNVFVTEEQAKLVCERYGREHPAKMCRYVCLYKGCFPRTVEELWEMFTKQTEQRRSENRDAILNKPLNVRKIEFEPIIDLEAELEDLAKGGEIEGDITTENVEQVKEVKKPGPKPKNKV